jgi:hypothetical protein
MANVGAQARKMGIIVEKDIIEKADKANDELALFSTGLKAAGIRIAAELLPIIIRLKEAIADPEFQSSIRNIGAGLNSMLTTLADNKEAIVTVLGALAGARLGRVAGGWGAVVGAIGGAGLAYSQMSEDAEKATKRLESQIQSVTERLAEYREKISSLQASGGIVLPQDVRTVEILEGTLKRLTNEYNNLMNSRKRATATPEGSQQDRAPAQITVGKAHFPEIEKVIKDLEMKRQVLAKELPGMADEFGEILKGLNLRGVETADIIGGGVSKLTGQFKALNDKLIEIAATRIGDELQTETEKLKEEYDKRLAIIATFEAARTENEEKAAELRKRLNIKYAIDTNMAIAQQYSSLANIVDTAVGQLSQIVGKEGGVAFNIMKGISMATALVKGYEAVVSAFAAGNKVGGPPLGFAFAAIAAAGVAAQIAALAMVQPQSSGAGSAPTAAGASGASTAEAAATAPQNQQRQAVDITLKGRIFGREEIRGLIGQINDAVSDGAVLRVKEAT